MNDIIFLSIMLSLIGVSVYFIYNRITTDKFTYRGIRGKNRGIPNWFRKNDNKY